jgi:hypothetical protein
MTKPPREPGSPRAAAAPKRVGATRACIGCLHSVQTENGALECHRFPPAAGRMADTAGRWPLVREMEACGEWKDMRHGHG